MAIIRKAGYKDLDKILENWKELVKQQRKLGIDNGKDLMPKMKENATNIVYDYLKRSIRSKHGFILVLEDEGTIQGYFHSRIEKNIPVFTKEYVGFVSDIYISDSYRGQGFGTKMFDKTMKWFQSKGITEISLRVLSYNSKAHDLYRKFGFKDIHIGMRLDLQ